MSDELSSNIMIEIIKDKNGKKKIKVRSFSTGVEVDENIKKKYIDFNINEIKKSFSTGVYSGYLELEEAIKIVKDALSSLLSETEKRIKNIAPDEDATLQLLKTKKELYIAKQKEIDETKELTKENVREFFIAVKVVDYQLPRELKLAYYNFSYKKFKCGDLKCKEYISKKVAKVLTQENLKKIIDETNNDEKANTLINSCEYFWHQQSLKKAIGNKKQEFRDSIPTMLNKIKSNFSAKFSKESSDKLTKYFKELKYAIADDQIPEGDDFEHLKYVKEEVLKIVEPKEDEHSEKSTADDSEMKGMLADYKKIKKHFMMGTVHFNNEISSCDQANVIADDHFSPAEYDPESYMHISSFSCNHYTTGKQVFAHEMGHAISGQFLQNKASEISQEKYIGHRECVTKNYKNKDFSGKPMYDYFSHPGDSKYSEEDMADFIASIIYNNPNENLLSCAFLAKDKNNKDYDRKELSILNPQKYDTHSSAFLRTLKEAIFKDKILTPSCRSMIEKYKDQINFNKCEFQ